MSKKNKRSQTQLNNKDYLLWPFARILTLVSLNIFFWQLVRTNESETWDKLIYATSLLIAFFTTLVKSDRLNRFIIILVGSISLLIGVIGVEKHGTQTTSGVDVTGLLWLGFGPVVFAVLVLLLPFVFELINWKSLNTISKLSLRLVALIVVILSLLSCWQTGNSIIDMYSSEYVLNEGLALPAGHFPYVDFIPQYGTLFSLIALPFKNIFDANGLVTFILIQHFIISIITILLGVYIVRNSFGKISWTLPTLLVVSFTCLTHLPNRIGFAGSIFDLIQEIPIRLTFGVVIGIFTVKVLMLTESTQRHVNAIIAGTLSGFGIWINQDFILLSGILSVGMLTLLSKSIKTISLNYLGYVIGFALYPIWVMFNGKSVNFSYFLFFVVQYTGGFMAEAIKTPGPVLIVLPLIVGLASLSLYRVFGFTFKKQSTSDVDKYSWFNVLYFSAWNVGGFLYYLNRSYASGQMQTLFLILAIAFGSYLAIFFRSEHYVNSWTHKNFFKLSYWKSGLKTKQPLIPISIVASLFLATAVAAPSPNIELKRINNAPEAYQWPSNTGRLALENYSKIKSQNPFPNKSIAYFGASGNYVELATGIKSANILNSPWDIPITQTTVITGCNALSAVNAEVLLLGPEALALFRFKNNTLCEKYKFVTVNGFKDGTFAVKV